MRAEPGRAPAAYSVLFVLSLLVALVGWARWRVGAHTVAQAVVATLLAVAITVGTFRLMGVPIAFPYRSVLGWCPRLCAA